MTIYLVNNGVGVNMLKVGSKRRRTTEEVKLERDESKKKEESLAEKRLELKAFEQKLHL